MWGEGHPDQVEKAAETYQLPTINYQLLKIVSIYTNYFSKQ